MRKETINRIDQLEKAIYGLRGMNHRDDIRDRDLERNLTHIISYTNEIFYALEDELVSN